MSDYETHRGKMRQVKPYDGETTVALCTRLCLQNNIDPQDDPIDSLLDQLYDKFFLVGKTQVWEILEDEESEYVEHCDIFPMSDETFSFSTTFYNGGTCLSEMLGHEILKQKI